VPKGGPSLGAEGSAGRALGLSEPRVGEELLEAVVLLGHPLTPGADGESGRDGQAPPDRGDELPRAPQPERRDRGVELEDHPHPEDGIRVPQQEPLPDGRSLPVRGIGPQPRDPPDSRMNRYSYTDEDFLANISPRSARVRVGVALREYDRWSPRAGEGPRPRMRVMGSAG